MSLNSLHSVKAFRENSIDTRRFHSRRRRRQRRSENSETAIEMQILEDRPAAPLPPRVPRFRGASPRDSDGYLLPTEEQPRSSGVYSYAYQDRIDSILASLLWLFRGRQNTGNVQRRRQEPSPSSLERDLTQSAAMLSSIAGNEETFDPSEPNSDQPGHLMFSPEVQDLSESRASASDACAPSLEAELSASTSGVSTTYDKINENQMMLDE